MTDYAVLACDKHPNYAFYAPLTCAVWKARGYTPLLMLARTEESWMLSKPLSKHFNIILDHCYQAGAQVHFLGDFPGHRTATVAQVSRLFAHTFVGGEDYLLTSDIDMWPLGPWTGGGREATKEVQIWYANAYPGAADGTGKVHFPMCYIGANARTWEEIVQGVPSRPEHSLGVAWNEEGLIEKALDLCAARPPTEENKGLVHRIHGDDIPLDIWDFDETYFGECLSKWPGFPEKCQMISRDMKMAGQKRIDRSSWRDVNSLDGYADAHLLHPGFLHWPRIRRLFQLVVPSKAAWADAYWKALDLKVPGVTV